MKVLWFVNVPLPAVCERYGWPQRGTGWWLSSLLREIGKVAPIDLTIAHCDSRYPRLERFEADGTNYWTIPARSAAVMGLGSRPLVDQLARLVNETDVDLVDVHGSEYVYGQVTPQVNRPVIVTVQGLVNAVCAHPYGRRNLLQALWLSTRGPGDLKPALLMLYHQVFNALRAHSERRVFRLNHYFHGRTAWDRRMVEQLSNDVWLYQPVEHAIRPQFRAAQWDGPAADRRALFFCSRPTPYKGLDDLILAVGRLRGRFANLTLRVAGDAGPHGWGGFLRRLARQQGVADRIEWLGYLDADAICAELRHCAAYVHPSYVDNSPMTLSEAQCVGVPCIGSTTGGIPSMIDDGRNGLLYATGDLDELTDCVARVLTDADLAVRLGAAARATATERHDPEQVARETLAAYQAVIADWRRRGDRPTPGPSNP